MTDSVLTKCKDEGEHKIVFSPRSGDEMENATLHKVPIHLYSDLCRLSKKSGSDRMLARLFQYSDNNIVLLQDPSDMNSGHWFCVCRNLPKHEIYFFSTYGGKPDVEKVQWMSEDDLRESDQFHNIFNDGLRNAQKHGWKIYYNDYPYQKSGDKTAVCGIYTAAFIRSGMNPDKFEEETKKLMKQGINPAVYYYRKYF